MENSIPLIVGTVAAALVIAFSVVITKQKQMKHILLLGKYWRTATLKNERPSDFLHFTKSVLQGC